MFKVEEMLYLSGYLQVFCRHTVVQVGDLQLGAIGGILADDRSVERGSDSSGAVLLGAGLVGLVITTLATIAGGTAAGVAATAAGRVVGVAVAGRAAGLLGLDNVIKGHVESGRHYER